MTILIKVTEVDRSNVKDPVYRLDFEVWGAQFIMSLLISTHSYDVDISGPVFDEIWSSAGASLQWLPGSSSTAQRSVPRAIYSTTTNTEECWRIWLGAGCNLGWRDAWADGEVLAGHCSSSQFDQVRPIAAIPRERESGTTISFSVMAYYDIDYY